VNACRCPGDGSCIGCLQDRARRGAPDEIDEHCCEEPGGRPVGPHRPRRRHGPRVRAGIVVSGDGGHTGDGTGGLSFCHRG
jgi:hypothetical protein